MSPLGLLGVPIVIKVKSVSRMAFLVWLLRHSKLAFRRAFSSRPWIPYSKNGANPCLILDTFSDRYSRKVISEVIKLPNRQNRSGTIRPLCIQLNSPVQRAKRITHKNRVGEFARLQGRNDSPILTSSEINIYV